MQAHKNEMIEQSVNIRSGYWGGGLTELHKSQMSYLSRRCIAVQVCVISFMSLCTAAYVFESCVLCPSRFTNRMGGRIHIRGSSLLHQVSWNVWWEKTKKGGIGRDPQMRRGREAV